MPRILTLQEVTAYLEWIRKGEGLNRAARQLGIPPKLFRDARAANPEFDEQVKQAEAEAAEPVEQKLYLAALQGEPWAVKLWLERRSTERWGAPSQTIKVEHGLSPGTDKLLELHARLQERQTMLGVGAEVIDAEVVEDSALEHPEQPGSEEDEAEE